MFELQDVKNSIIKNFKARGCVVDNNPDYGSNVIFIRGKDGLEIMRLYIQISSVNTFYWQLSKEIIDRLKTDNTDYKIILLSETTSITLSSKELDEIISIKSVARDGFYYINSNDCGKIFLLENSIEECYRNENNEKIKAGLQEFEVNTKIKMRFNKNTSRLEAISFIPLIEKQDENDIYIIHEISDTQEKFGIITLGSRNLVGAAIPKESEITIIHNGTIYNKKHISSHKSVGGRIDALRDFYNTFGIKAGDKYKVSYYKDGKILNMQTL